MNPFSKSVVNVVYHFLCSSPIKKLTPAGQQMSSCLPFKVVSHHIYLKIIFKYITLIFILLNVFIQVSANTAKTSRPSQMLLAIKQWGKSKTSL